MDDFHSDMDRVLRYAADDIAALLHALSQPEQGPHRWGHDDPLSGPRGPLADAMDDAGRTTEAELLRTPHQHVMVVDGRIRPARLTGAQVDHHLRNYNAHLRNSLPFGDPNWWNVMELEHRPKWYTLEDAEGNGTYNLSHPAHALGEEVAKFLEPDIGVHESNEQLTPEDAAHARELIGMIRNAPYEEIDGHHPSERTPAQ